MPEDEKWYRALLSAITRIQSQMLGSIRGTPLFEDLLAVLLQLSESEYGFIGETLIGDNGKPFLRTYAITNIAWNAETQQFYEENVRKGLEFRNLDTLFGLVMTSEAAVISNDPSTDPRRGGLPNGHPNLDAFLGLPLCSGGSMVGMLGVGNRSGGYDDELVRALEPFLQTCANAIYAFRADQERRRAEEQLRDEQARTRAMLDGVFDGIVMIDGKGRIESINHAAERMFGYANDDIAGHSVFPFLCEPFRSEYARLLSQFVKTGQPNFLDEDHELQVLRKTGESMPIRLRIAEVRIVGRRLFTGIVRDLSQQEAVERHVAKLTAELEQSHYGQMVGSSPPMRNLYRAIEQVADGRWPVLIEGETGVGKELVARAIHAASFSRDRPFVATNIAGLTDSLVSSQLFGHRRGAFTGADRDHRGLFEAADGGTLFLDEIGDISEIVQTSLLRVLQEGEITRLGESIPQKVNVRIVCATNGSLRARLKSGHFRKDLLYRLQVARVTVPPLRERREDIPLLAESFLAEARALNGKGITGFSPNAMDRLTRYEWPGNVRELRNVVDFVTIHCERSTATSKDLPPELLKLGALLSSLPETSPKPDDEGRRLLAAIEECDGNRSQAARILGISRATLYRRLETLGIS